MKKLIIIGTILTLILFSGIVLSQTYYPTNQKMVSWYAVTTDTNGDPITETVKYRVYLDMLGDGLEPPEGAIELTTTPITDTTFLVTLPKPGKYHVGVRAEIWNTTGDYFLVAGEIGWSCYPEITAPFDTWGLIMLAPPEGITGLHVVE